MAHELADINQGTAGSELLGNKSVSQVIDLGFLDTGKMKVSVKIRTDISD